MIYRKILISLLVVLMVLSACTGSLFFVRPVLKDNQRKLSESQLLTQIENGSEEIQIPYVPPVDGEAVEFERVAEESAGEATVPDAAEAREP